jgi:hypothetical protein
MAKRMRRSRKLFIIFSGGFVTCRSDETHTVAGMQLLFMPKATLPLVIAFVH